MARLSELPAWEREHHLQKIRDLRLVTHEGTWVIEYDATSDATMEQMAATARADLLGETFGRQVVIRPTGAQA